jgi:hypothetical protein
MMEIISDREKTEIISCVKTLLLINSEEKDSLLETILEGAYAYAVAYTREKMIPSAILVRMSAEDFCRSFGVSKKTRGGVSEEYLDGYSEPVMTVLTSMKRLRSV